MKYTIKNYSSYPRKLSKERYFTAFINKQSDNRPIIYDSLSKIRFMLMRFMSNKKQFYCGGMAIVNIYE